MKSVTAIVLIRAK